MPRARAGAAAALYAVPVAAASVTGDARAAVAAAVICAAHFQAERVLRSFEEGRRAADAGAADAGDDDDATATPSSAEAEAAARELATWDARLALTTARKAELAELAARAGVAARARDTKSHLVAALAAAGGLDEDAAPSATTAPWLADELAARGAAAVGGAAAKGRAKRRRRAAGKGGVSSDD